jgi:hypothetical protein
LGLFLAWNESQKEAQQNRDHLGFDGLRKARERAVGLGFPAEERYVVFNDDRELVYTGASKGKALSHAYKLVREHGGTSIVFDTLTRTVSVVQKDPIVARLHPEALVSHYEGEARYKI